MNEGGDKNWDQKQSWEGRGKLPFEVRDIKV